MGHRKKTGMVSQKTYGSQKKTCMVSQKKNRYRITEKNWYCITEEINIY